MKTFALPIGLMTDSTLHFLLLLVSTIIVNPYWRDLVEHARERRSVIPVPISSQRNNESGKIVRTNQHGCFQQSSRILLPDLSMLKALHPLALRTDAHASNNDEMSDGDFSA